MSGLHALIESRLRNSAGVRAGTRVAGGISAVTLGLSLMTSFFVLYHGSSAGMPPLVLSMV